MIAYLNKLYRSTEETKLVEHNDDEEKFDTEELLLNINQIGGTMEPGSTRMSLFQLAESTDLARITKVIEHLAAHTDLSKQKVNGSLSKVLQRYCNGEYGFDSYYSTSGRF